MSRSRFWWLTGIGLVLVLIVFTFRTRTQNYCPSCHSFAVRTQWKFGAWHSASLPLTPGFDEVRESHFFEDQLDGRCGHAWRFMQESPYYFFGLSWSGCALGRGPDWNRAAQYYEHVPPFRTLVLEREKNGAFSKAQFVEASRLSTEPSEIAGFTVREQALADLSERLLKDFELATPLPGK